ncbi:MAG TPA: hypothetical protein VMW83_06090 [Spirochaetia bacterium]|nr:hypothetical protein [Spirochaetia bacterium]
MAIRQLCVNEMTSIVEKLSERVTCATPAFSPVGPGEHCTIALYNVTVNMAGVPPTLSFSFDTQFEYEYLNEGTKFRDFCTIVGKSGSLPLPLGLTACCGTTEPQVTYSANCDPRSITTTPTTVSGEINLSFTVHNLCAPTVVCVEDAKCE